ncbi:MAG: TetR/AcrR family transcriptional regulator [Deltaproteobacteria bacterium]|nr:TetR/AcrR family transcriptional regulator [Deltaproteobacteria bacterium]
MPRLSKTAAMERRQELIAVAAQLFLKQGYENTTVNQIIGSLDLAKGTYYYHFRSKEDILIAVSDKLISDTREKLVAIHKQNDKDVLWRIREILSIFHDDFYRNRTIWKLVYHDNNIAMHKQVTKIGGKRFTPLLTDVIREGMETDLVHVPHAQETAQALISIFDIFSRQLCSARGHDKRVRIFETLRYLIGQILGKDCIPEFRSSEEFKRK